MTGAGGLCPFVSNKLRENAIAFAEERVATKGEEQTFWNEVLAIFGSLFQGIMEPRERRQIGGHYTSERDILKVVRALFLDNLRAEFERIKGNKNQLRQFHQKLSELRFLDPACGCGNFLVITYRELAIAGDRRAQGPARPRASSGLDIHTLSRVDVDAFYGIEISEWPARIAEVAMWLMDHQMNIRLSEEFGQYFVRLPLTKSPTIVCGNALRLDWKQVLPPEDCSYVLGNPPFVGKQFMDPEQERGHGRSYAVTSKAMACSTT